MPFVFLDFEKLVNKVNSRNLDEMQLSVERIKACDSILISGLSAQVTKDTITLYFENVRRSGGGDVKDVVLHKDTNSAVVYFEDGQGNLARVTRYRIAFCIGLVSPIRYESRTVLF